MNLELQLQQKYQAQNHRLVIEDIFKDISLFDRLVDYVFDQNPRVIQNASAILSKCIEKRPILAKPYLEILIAKISEIDCPVATKRNILRFLQFMDLEEHFLGHLCKLCINFIQSSKESVAVKAFSLEILNKIAKIYPEISEEVKQILQDNFSYQTPAIKHKAKKFL